MGGRFGLALDLFSFWEPYMYGRRTFFATLLLNIAIAGLTSGQERAIVPVVGSTAGANAANFRTEMQLHNSSNEVMRGSLVFVYQGLSTQPNPPAKLEYEIGPRETIFFEDVIESMGAEGLGSIDVLAAEGGMPRIVTRAFDDQGTFGTRGLMVPLLPMAAVPVTGDRVLIIAPANLERFRFNIGVRTIGSDPFVFTIRENDAAGEPAGEPIAKSFPPEFFAQSPAADFLGRAAGAGHTYTIAVVSGSGLVYATTVDNQTNDGALQIDKVINDAPVVDSPDLVINTNMNEPVSFAIVASDPNGDPFTVEITRSTSNGTLTLDEAAARVTEESETFTFTYTPNQDFVGTDGFLITFKDDLMARTVVAGAINVLGDNQPPFAVNDDYSVDEGKTLDVAAPGILLNDTDPENDPLTAELVTGPPNASVFALNADGSFTYKPRVGFAGSDVFTYRANDGTNTSNTARVLIRVKSLNKKPNAVDDAAATDEDTAIDIVVLVNDVDPEGAAVTVVSLNTVGTLGAVSINPDGTIHYDPTGSAVLQALPAGGLATDTFRYTIRDPKGGTDVAVVTVTVSGIDDLPLAVDDAATLPEDSPATAIGVLANDTDVDGGPITIDAITQGTNGAVAITGGGTGLTYQPNADYCGADSFTYTLNGGSSATVNVTVTCVNDAPTANGDAQTTAEDTQLVFAASTLTTNDVRGPANEAGQTLTVTAVTSPTANGGTVSLAGGNITYNPPLNFIGDDTFTYTVTDDGTTNGVADPQSANGTVTVTVVCPTITVINPATTTGTANDPFSQAFTQTGDVGGGLTFSTASALPTGLTLFPDGVLSGTPTQTGSFPIVVTATNSNGCSGTGATYTLVIACQVISVTNPANSSGTAGTAFSETFTQTGAIGATTFTTASTLPAGLTLSSAGVLSGTPTQTGSFPIDVTVTDSNGCTGTGATYTLVIACQTITVTNPANPNGTAGTAFSETFTQTSAIGTATFTTSSTLPAGLTLSAAGVLSGTPTVTGSFPIVVTVTDDNGCTGTGATYTLVIACQVITVTNPANTSGTAGAAFSETFTQTDAIGTATFTTSSTLPAGLTLSAAGVLSGTPTVTGSFPIVVTVTDDNGCTGTSATYTLVIACQTITVTNPATTTGTVNAPFSQTFTESSSIGGATFTTASTLPAGLTLATNGTLSGTPTQPGTFPIVVTVTDGNGCTGTSATYNLVIGCQTITVTSPANANGTAASAFSETFTQSGAFGGATFTTASTLPAGLTLATNGVLSGTPTQTGTFPIVVTVTDGNGCTGTSATYNLVIACQVITVTNPANATGPAGTAFSETFTQTGAIGSATFTTASTLPTGLTLATNGVLSGTPTQGGTFPIVVTVTDANGCTGTSATYNLVITCPTITVNNPANANGTAGTAFSETFTQTGGVGAGTFTLASGTLPTGLTLATDGTLSGTPTQTGSFPITVTATDANGCTGTGSTYTIVIACQTLTVNNPANANGTANSAFSETFTQTDGIGAITYTLASGTLPAGITLATDGTLSGTPTETGSFPITVTATDANGCTGTGATYTLVIACQTITVTNPANAAGTLGTAFSETFTQTNAIGAVTFTTASTLPTGLTLSTAGVLSGTPTQPGNFPIVVTVTDANGCTGTGATYNLVIACQTITVTNPANANGTVGTAFSETFTQSGAIGGATFTTASTLPAGLSLSTAGVLSGTPTQSGSFPITVTVTDGNGCTGTSATYTLVIACQTITVTNPANANGTVGSAFSETFTQTGAIGTATFTTSSTLPAGMTLATNGVLSGTPTQTGTFPIVVTVTDSNGCTGTGATYNLVIACQVITVTNPGTSAGTVDAAFSQTFTQSGAIGAVTFTTSSTLPSGLSLSTAGVLSGTPGQPGTFPITVTVTDSNGCTGTSATYNLVIACQLITVTNPGVTTAIFNTAFNQSFGQTGVGTHTPAIFTLASGTLPTGLTLSSAGVLSGTPSVTGTYQMTVTVTDANGCFGTGSTYTLSVIPAAVDDSYSNLVNNTEAVVTGGTTASPGTPFVALTGTIIANDEPSGGISLTVGTFATTQGGSVTTDADGTFKYTPPAAPGAAALASDTFTYTITSDTGATGTPTQATGTVTFNLANRVWYVKNDFGGGGNGQSQAPFDTLVEAQTASTANDYVFVYFGDGATTGQTDGFVVKNGQKLYGQGVVLIVNTHTLVAATSRPLIDDTTTTAGLPDDAGVVVDATAGAMAAIEIRGLNIRGNENAIDVTSTGANAIGVTIDNNTIRGSTAGEDIDINQGSTSITSAVIVTNNTWDTAGTHPGNAIDVARTAGTVSLNISDNTNILSTGAGGINVVGGAVANTFITGFTNNTVHPNTTGTGISVSNATFDTVAGTPFVAVTGGTTTIGTTGNGVGGGGMILTSVLGDLSFSALNIVADGGTALFATSTGTFNAGTGAGFRIVETGNDSVLTATGGAAVDLTTVTADLQLSTVTSTNSSSTGVNLDTVLGTFTAASGSSITNASGTDFRINVGSANVTYNGTITDDVGQLVSVASATGGTKSFTGAITDGDDGDGSGISLTNNTGATITFSGGLTLSTGGNAAFTATGGGTINVVDPAGAASNKVTTTTATAVNISTPSNIGGSGATFERITVNNGGANSAANAIILNGTTGAFTVSGDGSTARNGSGGTLNRTTGHSVLLTNASNVTLRQMNITNTAASASCPAACSSNGINSSGGSNIVLSAMNFDALGGHGWYAVNVGGTSGVNTNSRFAAWNSANAFGVYVDQNVAFSAFTVDGSLFTTSVTGADGFLFDGNTGSSGTVNVTNSEFTLIDQDAVQINNDGAGTITALVQGNNFHDADSTGGDGNNTLFMAASGSGVLNFTIGGAVALGNTFNNLGRLGCACGVVQVNAVSTSQTGTRISGTIQNNTISNSTGRRGIDFGIEANGGAHGGHTINVLGNTISNTQNQGINILWNSVNGGDVTGNDFTISGNTLTSVGLVGNADSGSGIEIENNSANAGGNFSADVLIQNNTVSNNNTSAVGSTLELVSRSLFAGDTTTINYTVWGNTLTNSSGGGEVFEALGSGTAGTLNVCLDLNGASVVANQNSFGNGGSVRLTNNYGNYNVGGMTAGGQSAANVQTHVTARNTFIGGSAVTAGGVVGTFNGSPGGCTLP